jgi:hypothetical protein
MSYFSAFEQACPNLQEAINTAWQNDIGQDNGSPFVDYIASAANQRGVALAMLPGQGKIKKFELKYRRRALLGSAETNVPNPTCTGTGYYGNEITEYDLDPDVNISVSEAIPLTANERACTPNAEFFAEKIQWHLDWIRREVYKDLTEQAVANHLGAWGQAVTVDGNGNYEMATLLNGNPNPFALPDLQNAVADSGMGGEFAVFGGAAMRSYFQAINRGCCANYGIDISQMAADFGFAFAYDKYLQKAFAADPNAFAVLKPGALQVLNYSRAEGAAASFGEIWSQGANYLYTTIQDPATGLKLDLMAKDECGTLNIRLIATNKVISLPTDLFAPGDEYEGVTGFAPGLVSN